jgi:hypothetical protein
MHHSEPRIIHKNRDATERITNLRGEVCDGALYAHVADDPDCTMPRILKPLCLLHHGWSTINQRDCDASLGQPLRGGKTNSPGCAGHYRDPLSHYLAPPMGR